MGNWRLVQIIGTMSCEDAAKVSDYLAVDYSAEHWGCLHNGGFMGLPNWGLESVDVIGNLGERDFTVDDIAEELLNIAKIAPSIDLKIHCGGDYESGDCVNTIACIGGGVTVGDPEIDELREVDETQVKAALFAQLFRK